MALYNLIRLLKVIMKTHRERPPQQNAKPVSKFDMINNSELIIDKTPFHAHL